MIISLQLENWKTHSKSIIRFSRGVNLIVGVMGSGKSSVLEAICYALFGTIPALKGRHVRITDLKNFRFQEQKLSVQLEFVCSGRTYRVIRSVSASKSDAELHIDGKLVEKGSERVTEFVCKVIESDYSLFNRAAFAEQNKIAEIFSLTPQDRKTEIDRLLGIDKFEAARKNVSSSINSLNSGSQTLRSKADISAFKRLEAERDSLQAELALLESGRAGAEKEFQRLQSLCATAEAAHRELKLRYEKHKLLERECLSLTARIETIRKSVDPSQDYKALFESRKAELARVDALISEKTSQLKSLSESKNSLAMEKLMAESRQRESEKAKAEISSSSSLLEKIGLTSEQLDSELSAIESRKDELSSEKSRAEAMIEACQRALKSISPGIAKCPVCRKPLESHDLVRLSEENQEQIRNSEERCKEISSELRSLSSSAAALKQKKSSVAELTLKISQASSRVSSEDFKSLLASLQSRMASLARDFVACENSADTLRAERDSLKKSISECESALESIAFLYSAEKELASKQSELSSSSAPESEYESSSESLAALKQSFSDSRHALEIIRVKIKEKSDLLASLSSRIGDMKALLSESSAMEASAATLSIFKNCLESSQVELRSSVLGALNAKMEMLWKNLYPYGDISSVRLDIEEAGYSFKALKNDWIDIAVLSGGEKSCVAIAFRLALSHVLMPKLNVFFMDEPTHNLDSEAVKTLALLLEERIPSLIGQTIIITHDSGLIREGFASVILLKRDKQADGFTEICTQ